MARKPKPKPTPSEALAPKAKPNPAASPTSAKMPDSKPDTLPKASPDLFEHSRATRMASALPIWEASNILTQRKHLPWAPDPNGKLYYAKDIGNGQGALHFWVTEDLETEHPSTLAGAAALAVIDTFDIRAACMHLIYAAHAAQLDRPWEQELVITDQQIEAYLGLKKRTDKNRQEKLALIEEIAKQPCKITTFISWPRQGKVKGFTIEEGRLWHILGTRYHYQETLFGKKELTGITFVVRPGLWTRYFLNEEGQREKTAFYQQGYLAQDVLEGVMSVWQHREGAARLMVWLMFQTQFSQRSPLTVEMLMEIAYGREKVDLATTNSEARKKLVNTWDDDLLALHDRGWELQFDAETYPPEIQPLGFGRSNYQRPRGFFDHLLKAQLWIRRQDGKDLRLAAAETPHSVPAGSDLVSDSSIILTGQQVKALRTERNWSQRKLAAFSGISQGLISLIESGERSITADTEAILKRVFELDLPAN
ncbi:helix-turn-helix transcriptional regulator [Alkalinema sp. FACHB-956]|uniref:helix-turn-helix domain-containing protein n=1 Tax=Alkalinema sp. FACHB-956 TaxID=2692768 RepID=UPI001F54AC60|nr:helix-turn-helix transcriptional regulator [Alkalinema sp. FACHB-956]